MFQADKVDANLDEPRQAERCKRKVQSQGRRESPFEERVGEYHVQ